MWLSLIMAQSASVLRCDRPPPARTACFSSARSPGVVLRVSHTAAPVPAMVVQKAAVTVAMPERCWRKLSATRSAARIERTAPETSITWLGGTTWSPSAPPSSMARSGSTAQKACAATSAPHRVSGSRARMRARPLRAGLTTASVVRSP